MASLQLVGVTKNFGERRIIRDFTLRIQRGDRILLMLGNVVPLWETMLAAMKLGVVVIPATTLLTAEELADRVERGRALGQAGHELLVRAPTARPRRRDQAEQHAARGAGRCSDGISDRAAG